MKFGQHLDQTAVPEWRSRYISYRSLKKEIKNLAIVKDRKKRIVTFTRTRSSERTPILSPRSIFSGPRSTPRNSVPVSSSNEDRGKGRRSDRPNREERSPRNEVESSKRQPPLEELDIGEPYAKIDETLPGQSSSKSAGALSDDERSQQSRDSTSAEESQPASVTPINIPKSPYNNVASHAGARQEESSPRSVFQIANSLLRQRRPTSQYAQSPRSTGATQASESQSASPMHRLTQETNLLPKDEIRFFDLLDKEAIKISDFYAEKEQEACHRFKEIHQQLHQLRAHHNESAGLSSHLLPHPRPLRANVLKSIAEPITSAVKTTIDLVQVVRNSQTTDPVLPTENTQTQDSSGGQRGEHVETHNEDQVNEVPYSTARRRLKLAVFEYYRGLEMLKDYKVLNREGFYKILKKYDKATDRDMSPLYMSKVSECNFVQSKKINKLITETEGLFARYFEGGSRKKAMDRLRVADQRPTHHFSTNRSGIYLGASLVLIIQAGVMSSKASVQASIPQWALLLQIYAIFALPIIFSLLVGINLVIWRRTRINYAFIFELDVRTMLDAPQYFEFPAVLLFLLSVAFYLSFLNPNPGYISPYYYPLIWFVVMLVLLFNPLRIARYSARWWTISSFAKVAASGFFFVDFKSFFLGDEWNSLSYSTYGMGVFICSYKDGWSPDVENTCNSNKYPIFFALACLPAYFRFVQCWRRYYDTGAKVHILNAFKYMSTMLFYIFLGVWRVNELNGNPSNQLKALFIVFACFYSLYTSTWDIFIDWAVGRPRAKYPFLRNGLLYPTWFYYIAIPLDVGIRFGWTVYLRDETVTLRFRSFAYAFFEMLRRFMWNFFRVEAEQQLNIGQYRANREVPLPYHITGRDESEDDGGKEDGTSNLKGRGSSHDGSRGAQRGQEDEHPSQYTARQGTALLQAATKFVGLRSRAQTQSDHSQREAAAETVARGTGQGGRIEDEVDIDQVLSDHKDIDSDLESGHAIGG